MPPEHAPPSSSIADIATQQKQTNRTPYMRIGCHWYTPRDTGIN